jgi:hypothetical protein
VFGGDGADSALERALALTGARSTGGPSTIVYGASTRVGGRGDGDTRGVGTDDLRSDLLGAVKGLARRADADRREP